MFIDTHCHLDDKKLIDDIDNVVERYLNEKVTKTINVGCNAQTSKLCSDMADKFDSIYFASGIHPIDAKDFCQQEFDEIASLCDKEKCVAVGEIGLDYYWDDSYKTIQKQAFNQMIDLANQKKLPMSIHMRNATAETLEILKSNRHKLTFGGSLHCFSGSVETAREILNLGLKIGFGGTLTFKNANKILEVAKFVPLDSILTETDCPYLSPEPLRGKVNEPKNIPIICAFLAKLKNIELPKMAEIIMDNAKQVFYKLK